MDTNQEIVIRLTLVNAAISKLYEVWHLRDSDNKLLYLELNKFNEENYSELYSSAQRAFELIAEAQRLYLARDLPNKFEEAEKYHADAKIEWTLNTGEKTNESERS